MTKREMHRRGMSVDAECLRKRIVELEQQILSSMPIAFTALIPPSIYDLDLDLANSCWFFTTALLAVVLPVLLVIINLI